MSIAAPGKSVVDSTTSGYIILRTRAETREHSARPVTNMKIQAQPDLWGLKVLLVEDSALVAMHLEDMLHEAGCEIIGPVGRIDQALDIARHGDLDVAVLDINVQGEKVFGVADELRRRGIPFVFSTGYGMRYAPDAFRDAPYLSKPFEPENLWSAISVARRQHLETDRRNGH